MSGFSTFIKTKKTGGGKVKFDKRSMRTHMTIIDSTKLRMAEEIREIREISEELSISDTEMSTVIDKVSLYPNFTIINTKLIVVCMSLMKKTNSGQNDSDQNFGQQVLKYKDSIYKIFNVTDEVKKMKLKEDIVVYTQYIENMNDSVHYYDSEEDSEEDYEELSEED